MVLTNETEEVPRDRYGRYLVKPMTGDKATPYTRATTVASTLSDTFGLTNWKLRTLALGFATREDLYALASTADPNDKKTLDKICQDAIEAGKGSSGANFGTALHAAVARLNRGEAVTMPAPWQSDLDAYTKALTDTGVTIDAEYVERVVVLDDLKIAGTFDAVATLPDGRRVIADLKTGQDLAYSWNEIAVQLAIYAHADDIYRPATAFRFDMPAVDQTVGLVIHLPAGKATCTFHLVDLEAGWNACQLALTVRAWRTNKKLTTALTHDGPIMPRDGARDQCKERVEKIRDHGNGALQLLADRWPAGIPSLKADHSHTAVELEQIVRVLASVELDAGIPF